MMNDLRTVLKKKLSNLRRLQKNSEIDEDSSISWILQIPQCLRKN